MSICPKCEMDDTKIGAVSQEIWNHANCRAAECPMRPTIVPAAVDPNDPLPRQMPDEPRFALLARDPLAPFVVRLYAALRERKIDKAQDVFRNACRALPALPFHPQSDPEHARSAFGVADHMELWLIEKTREQLGAVPGCSDMVKGENHEQSSAAASTEGR